MQFKERYIIVDTFKPGRCIGSTALNRPIDDADEKLTAGCHPGKGFADAGGNQPEILLD
jgi:hypothetical protein